MHHWLKGGWTPLAIINKRTDLAQQLTLETWPLAGLQCQNWGEQQRRWSASDDSAGTHPLPDSLPTKWRQEERQKYCPAGRNDSSFTYYATHLYVSKCKTCMHTYPLQIYILCTYIIPCTNIYTLYKLWTYM